MESKGILSNQVSANSATEALKQNGCADSEISQEFLSILDLLSNLTDSEGLFGTEDKSKKPEEADANSLGGMGLYVMGWLEGLQQNYPGGMEALTGRQSDQGVTLDSILTKESPINNANISGKIVSDVIANLQNNDSDLNNDKFKLVQLLTELNGQITEKKNQSSNISNIQQKLTDLLEGNVALKQTETLGQQNAYKNILKLPEDNLQIHGKQAATHLPLSLDAKVKTVDMHEGLKPLLVEDYTQPADINVNPSGISQKPEVNFTNSLNKAQLDVIPNQIAQYFKQNLTNDTKEVKQFEIQLHPAELGKVDISLNLQDGKVHLFLRASESITEASLQQQLPILREKLESIGIACGSMQMSPNNRQFNGQQARQQAKYINKKQIRFNAVEDAGVEKIIKPSFGYDSPSQINVKV